MGKNLIRQEIIRYPDTFKTKEYKEYFNGVLNVHSKYDEDNNKVYQYLAYDDFEWEKRYIEGTTNSNGFIIYYKDNKGLLNEIKGGLEYVIRPIYGFKIVNGDEELAHISNKILVQKYNKLRLKEEPILKIVSKVIDGFHYSTTYNETLPDGNILQFNYKIFCEIYYEYHEDGKYTGKRKIITFDELMKLTQFKDFMIEHKIIPVHQNFFRSTRKNIQSKSLFL